MLHATCSQLSGPVEVDETYIGSATKNKHKREHICGGTNGKTAIVGIKDRKTNQMHAAHLPDCRGNMIQPFIIDNVPTGATVYSDDSIICSGLRGTAQLRPVDTIDKITTMVSLGVGRRLTVRT